MAGNTVKAQLSLTNGSPSAIIDFKTTIANVSNGIFNSSGFQPAAAAGQLSSNAWAITGFSDGPLAFGGTQTTASTDYTRGSTNVAVPTTGGIYAYTGAPNSAIDPALLMQPVAADLPAAITLKIVNNGTSIINQLNISYKVYQRNDQARSQVMRFSYSTDNVTYTSAGIDYATPTTATANGWEVGATPSTSLSVSIPQLSVYYIRWTSEDNGGSGVRDEIGLDDINIAAVFPTACTPPTINATLTSFSNVLSTQMDVNFTRGNGTGGIIIVASPAALTQNPISYITYTANANYGTGQAVTPGNGFVVFRGAAAGSGNPSSFTLTGLTPGTSYTISLFEYEITAPCYFATGASGSQSTTGSSSTAATDRFRSKMSGNWANATTWQSSNDGGATWNNADRVPTSAASIITVQAGHSVDVSSSVSMDETVIAGTLTVLNSGIINLNDGPATDIDIQATGILKFQTTANYTTTFIRGGTATLNVATFGKITVGNGASTPGYSPLGFTPSYVTWNDQSVFEWNTTDPFITSGMITYFPGVAANVIPVFRVSTSPSLVPGAGTSTIWSGLMEVNSNLTLRLAGTKIFRNGIIGTAAITQDDDCGPFIINGTTAKLGVATVNLNTITAAGLDINSACVTTMTANVIVNSAGTGVLTVSGSSSLYCDGFMMSGTGIFTLLTASTMRLGSAGGISSAGLTGNIQTSGLRTFNTNTNFIFNGVTNQVTGTGMPITLAALTIINTGGGGNNTVTLTTAPTGAVSLTLTSGLFAAGTAQQLNIFTGGTVTATSGDFATGVTGGIINFQGTGTFSGNSNPYDVYASGGVNFGSNIVTIQNGGSFRINAGGFANTNGPYYANNSSLVYNSGGSYAIGEEWKVGTVFARAIPQHVTVLASGTAVTLENTFHGTRRMFGNMLLSPNTSLTMSTTPADSLFIKGNWTRDNTATYVNNGRLVHFDSTGTQTITVTGGGTETFGAIHITKAASNLVLASGTNVTIAGFPNSAGYNYASNSLIMTTGNIELGNQTMNFVAWNGVSGNINNILVDGSAGNNTRTIQSSLTQGTFNVLNNFGSGGPNITIARNGVQTSKILIFSPTVKLTIGAPAGGSCGIDFGFTSAVTVTTIQGIFQINKGGFVSPNPPIYATNSTLVYNTTVPYNRYLEWSTTSGPGYPYNVTVQAASTVLTVNSGSGDANRQIGGTLTISANAALILNNSPVAFFITILGDFVLDGSITLPGTLPAYGADIKLAGNWTRSATGTFIPNERAVFFIGSGNSTITANNGELFPYLYITKTAVAQTVSLNDNISVGKILGLNTGTLVLGNKDVILQSKDTTASLDKITSGQSAISYTGTGRFIVERYIPTALGSAPFHGKSWQFLAVPVNQDNQTVNAAWQEGQAPLVVGTANRGTIISNSVTGSGGFDIVGGVGGSMKTYVAAGGTWSPIAGTGITHYNQKGYMTFIRGDRSVNTYNGTPVVTTLRTRGKVMEPGNAPPSTNIAANVFESIGNPYPAVIDFSNTTGVARSSANIQDVFYVWDPRLGGGYGYGGWQTMTKVVVGVNYNVSPGGGSYGAGGSVVNTIQSGQAFLVHTVGGGGTITFNENAKFSGSGNALVTRPGTTTALVSKLSNQLSIVSGNNTTLIDGVVDEFDRSFSNSFDRLDAIKMTNVNENLAISRADKLLAVERKAMIRDGDTIHYHLGQVRVQQYQFEFAPQNIARPGLKAFLVDRYLATKTQVSLSDTTRIRFNIENIPGSYAPNRFMLVFNERKQTHQLYSVLKAEQTDDAILLSWKTGEGNVEGSFEIEQSADGVNYRALHSEPVDNRLTYSWKDLNPLPGSTYYRIHNLDKESNSYSNQVKIAQPGKDQQVAVYPNPVRDQLLGLRFKKLTAGSYQLKLYNNNGQVSWNSEFVYDGVAGTKQFKIPVLSNGIYKLEVIAESGMRESLQVFVY